MKEKTCPTCGQPVKKKKKCPSCKSTRIIMFDADNDLCEKCGHIFQGS